MTHYDRARQVIPIASLTRSKAPGRFYPIGEGPHYAVYGRGAMLYTDTGAELVDMLCALGAISLGYGITPVDELRAMHEGVFSLPSMLEAEAAEMMLAHVAPWAERVKFTKTGSESVHAAYRIAKAATGRPLVLVFEGSYHGWYEWSWRDAQGVPESPYTIVAPYGVVLADWLAANVIQPEEIAAVFIEPHRWQPTRTGWLHEVRLFCKAHGIVLVYDEMIFGGRVALGGASEFFGVQPDMACFGKALGNGAAIAAVVGPVALLSDHGGMVSGTFSGDTVGLSAFIETVQFYRAHRVIDHLWQRGTQLYRGMQEACFRHPSLNAIMEGAAPVHQRIKFADPALGHEFSRQMMLRDILWLPDCANVMWSHTPALIDQVVQAADDSMTAMEASR